MIKIKKDAPMRMRAIEALKLQGKPGLAKELQEATTARGVLKVLNKSLR
jgi:hypothetical protein